MTFEPGILFLVAVAYLSALFLIAYATERGWIPARLVRHPLVYALSLGVYATSWSYYGSVGFAEEQGLMFLTIYLGPTLAFILTPILLAPLLRLIRDCQLTSLADLFAFRYSSQLAGILVTLFMLGGTLPYIALQIRAVSESLRILTGGGTTPKLGLIFCIILMIFAVLFGARHISPREKHEGLVLAIAFESLVKLAALLAVALFAVLGVFGGPGGLEDWLEVHPQALQALYEPVQEGPWQTLILLSFAAAFLLPRQFHMGFVENLESRSLASAAWAFPLFLLLFNLAIPPILWAAQVLQPGTSPDYYVLGVALAGGDALLPVVAFIGGLSAASAMVIVTTLALAQMALNHLLLPASYPDPAVDMYRWLLWGRRMLIGLIILISYGLYVILEHGQGLVQLGLISFVAVAQFLPGIAGVLFWPRATRAGFLAGLTAGALIWYAALMMPLLYRSGVFLTHFNLLEALGASAENPWEFVTFWSLAINTLLFIAVSLITRPDSGEQHAIAACFQDQWLPGGRQVTAGSPQQFSQQLARIIGAPAAAIEVDKALGDLAMDPGERRPGELQRLRDRLERNLSGMLGPVLARMIVESRLPADANTRSLLAEHIRFAEERLEQSRSQLRGLARELDALRRYHRQILEDLPVGACSLAADHEILNWNQAMERLSGIDRHSAVGCRAGELPEPWSALLEAFLTQTEQHIPKTRVVVHGRPRWFNLYKAAIGPLSREESWWGGTVVLVEDLTELQTLELELTHSERLASIGRLAAGVAHEIGNPVTGIACIAQNLIYEDDPEVIEESAEDILQQTRRIDEIVRSLITFSHGGAEQRIAPFNLCDCITDARRLVSLSHHAKQLECRIDCAGDLMLEGDRQRLLQVFVNLLSNACDASRPGGAIAVGARLEQDSVAVTVGDRGEGIPEELLSRVFEPFFTTKEPGRGTGLGLPLVYSIVQDHRGNINIASEPGRGTRVTLRLPLRQSLPVRTA